MYTIGKNVHYETGLNVYSLFYRYATYSFLKLKPRNAKKCEEQTVQLQPRVQVVMWLWVDAHMVSDS